VLNTLGLALYRLGRFEESVSTLERPYQIYKSAYDGLHYQMEFICLAMAQYRLGRIEEARKTLVLSRDEKKSGTSPAASASRSGDADRGQMNDPED
jgi:hypothetical protein